MKSFKIKKVLNRILFGEKRKGEKIFEKEIKFHTFVGEESKSFNDWCREVNISSLYSKPHVNETGFYR